MPPKKKFSIIAPELIQEQTSAPKKRKQFSKDNNVGNEAKKKRPRETVPQLLLENECNLSSPNESKIKRKRSLKKNQENQENLIKSEAEKPDSEEIQNFSVDEMNVEQLLILGEKLHGVGFSSNKEHFEESSDSDMGDFEEVKGVADNELVIPKEGVNITLEVPNLYNKRKKKGLDLEAHLKRQMNRVRKDLQLLMHKVHVLCWIAHLRFVNSILNNPALMKSCALLVKSKNLYPSRYADLSYLEGILKWFFKNIEYKKDVVDPLCTGGPYKELRYQIEKKQAFSCRAFIFMFIILLRILGLKARIVMSFQVLPVKPSLLELYGDVIKARSEKLKNLKENEISKEKINSENSGISEGMPEAECFSKLSKRISTNSTSNDQKKRNQKDSAKPIMELYNSDDGFESENYRSSSKSAKKNAKSKSEEKKQNNLTTNSKSKSRKSTVNTKNQNKNNLNSEEDEDNDFTPVSLKKKEKKKIDKKSDIGEEPQKKKEGVDIWVEVFLEAEEKWISVDVPRQKIHCIGEIYSRATHPVTYVIACNNDHTLKDVTKRYVPNWHSDTRKRRVDEEWWKQTMKPYLPARTVQDKEEDEDINRQLLDKPLPSSLSEFKDHPLYALKRHLLKFEAIYPPNAPTLGFVRGEPIYARECVHILHSREMWYKQARVVRVKEEPYKTVKARPKYDKMTGEIKRDLPLELFGKWQTEDFIPPIATDGKVPRNEYGNVDLFKLCMLPIGTVHLQIPALNRIAKRLDIDCAPATVGFEFHSGGSHPVFDGFVVCEEFKDILLDAWNKEIDESSKKEAEKREKRVYDNWKKLIRGLLIREKLKIKYAFGQNSDESGDSKLLAGKSFTS